MHWSICQVTPAKFQTPKRLHNQLLDKFTPKQLVQVIHTCHAGNIYIVFQFTKALMLDYALILV